MENMGLSKTLFIPDCHRPYHDKRAWSLLLKVARKLKPDTIVVLGDFVDFYQVSSHEKDLRDRPSFAEEIHSGNEGLDELDQLGAKRKVFIEGNHEQRLERFLNSERGQAQLQLLQDAGVVTIKGTQELLNLAHRGWEFVPYKRQIRLGKLYASHDYGSAGATAHTKAESVVGGSVVIGHTHRIAYSVVGNMKNRPHVAAMFGWLGDAEETNYMHRAKSMRDWALGFGIGYTDKAAGTVYLTPVPLVHYSCVVNGELFSV